ncbi:DsbA family protein [Sphingomonas sp.]|uniref:DsbA family protein n=1 Tax=Sphingomonas sp. TaxID=28214 RepID=UPI00286A0917|nr:thioredoxin domain-containing protein [Sphingomonas sp.]
MSASRSAPWIAAIGGGLIGSLATAGLLLLAAPKWVGPKLVRDALVKQPQILVDASEALRDGQYAPILEANRAALETPFGSSWKGAAAPKVVMTYFYDYACGYCRKSNPDIERLLAEEKGLRVVYRELPILGPDSVAASRAALAASKAGRFGVFHDALYAAGRPSTETIAIAGSAAAITPEQARDPAIEAEIQKNLAIAGQLGANGTPLFVIGDKVINSAVGYEVLKAAIEAAKAKA